MSWDGIATKSTELIWSNQVHISFKSDIIIDHNSIMDGSLVSPILSDCTPDDNNEEYI